MKVLHSLHIQLDRDIAPVDAMHLPTAGGYGVYVVCPRMYECVIFFNEKL